MSKDKLKYLLPVNPVRHSICHKLILIAEKTSSQYHEKAHLSQKFPLYEKRLLNAVVLL